MRWLRFLSKLAFVCNVFFLLAFSIQLTNWIKDEQLESTIVVIGYVMGFLINPITIICYFFTAISYRKGLKEIPAWLIVANIMFLIIQAFFILYLNAASK